MRIARAVALHRATWILSFVLALQGCGVVVPDKTALDPATVRSAPGPSTLRTPAPAAAAAITFTASTYTVAQLDGSVVLKIARTGLVSAAVSVDYTTADGSAFSGVQYAPAAGTLQWGENDSSDRSISIALSSTPAFAGAKSFAVILSNPSRGVLLGNPGVAIVTISGAASASTGMLQFAAAAYSIPQSAGSVQVAVNRASGAIGPTSIDYTTNNGTATAGIDYLATSGVLTWADGDSAAKTLSVPISNSSPFSGSHTFGVTLSNPTSGAITGDPDTSTISISGDASAAPGSLQLASPAVTVNQSAGSMTISVVRVAGSAGALSVSYATNAGTALAGTDFTATSGTLQWADGDAAPKTFTVGISDANPYSASKAFNVVLSNPGVGTNISNPGSETITINGAADPAPPGGKSTFWVYYNGLFSWGGDYSSGAVANYRSRAGTPQSGSYDIAMTLLGPFGLWAPYAGGSVPTWNFDASGYDYITLDLQPTVANQVWLLYFMEVGDVPIVGPNGEQAAVNLANYGPAPVPGKWATYKVPLALLLTQYSSGHPVYETKVYKFGVQDKTGLSQNLWYIDNVGFTD